MTSQMTDSELLELAAKAAGVCLHPQEKLAHSYGNWGCDTTCTVCKQDPSSARWNPLTDDGDALRLAVRLRLGIDHNHPADSGAWVAVSDASLKIWSQLEVGDETSRAEETRRAIVRAAAEIGRAMP